MRNDSLQRNALKAHILNSVLFSMSLVSVWQDFFLFFNPFSESFIKCHIHLHLLLFSDEPPLLNLLIIVTLFFKNKQSKT